LAPASAGTVQQWCFNYDFKGAALNEHSHIMSMEDFGYVLAEAPFLVLIVWSTVKLVRWRRSRENRPGFSANDRHMLFHAAQYGLDNWQFYPRFVLAVFAVTTLGSLQIIVLAPVGAAILAGVLVLTSSVVVHGLMLRER
jgi:hypothetical protein